MEDPSLVFSTWSSTSREMKVAVVVEKSLRKTAGEIGHGMGDWRLSAVRGFVS